MVTMTRNQQILFDLLKDKGVKPKTIWFEPTFGIQPGGWFATDEEGWDYKLGRDFIEAKGNIQNNEHEKIED